MLARTWRKEVEMAERTVDEMRKDVRLLKKNIDWYFRSVQNSPDSEFGGWMSKYIDMLSYSTYMSERIKREFVNRKMKVVNRKRKEVMK